MQSSPRGALKALHVLGSHQAPPQDASRQFSTAAPALHATPPGPGRLKSRRTVSRARCPPQGRSRAAAAGTPPAPRAGSRKGTTAASRVCRPAAAAATSRAALAPPRQQRPPPPLLWLALGAILAAPNRSPRHLVGSTRMAGPRRAAPWGGPAAAPSQPAVQPEGIPDDNLEPSGASTSRGGRPAPGRFVLLGAPRTAPSQPGWTRFTPKILCLNEVKAWGFNRIPTGGAAPAPPPRVHVATATAQAHQYPSSSAALGDQTSLLGDTSTTGALTNKHQFCSASNCVQCRCRVTPPGLPGTRWGGGSRLDSTSGCAASLLPPHAGTSTARQTSLAGGDKGTGRLLKGAVAGGAVCILQACACGVFGMAT